VEAAVVFDQRRAFQRQHLAQGLLDGRLRHLLVDALERLAQPSCQHHVAVVGPRFPFRARPIEGDIRAEGHLPAQLAKFI